MPGGFPYRSQKIAKGAHLAYHVEGYIQEVMMVLERFRAYLTLLGRLYRGHSSYPALANLIKVLRSDAVSFPVK